MSNFSKGSEWRKWDLHVHTPLTKLNNKYSSNNNVWDTFCYQIERSDVSVFGITDYFSLDNYFTFMGKFTGKYPESKKVFFPNIEFRIDSKNSSNEHVQIHVIFSNEIEKDKLEQFLTRLKLVSTDDINLTNKFCTSNDLRAVGYEKAMVTINDLKKQLESSFTIDQYLIIGVANGYGSLRPGPNDGRGAEYAKEIDKICHAFFGNENNINFYLNKIEGRNQYNLPPKAILRGSDCHSFEDINNKLGKEFTWIKADPNFEGLKQTIYEPEERVFIGDEPEILRRVRENKTKFIKSIKINQVNGYNENKGVWFKNIDISLNPGLVAIIGNKGNGKSALTDIISLCGNSHLYGDFSFLKEEKFLKDGLAKYFEAELTWESEEKIKKNLSEKTDINSPQRVRYLPQNFFERLTNNLETYDFEKTLEEVVFSYIPEEQKLNKKSFSELIEYKKHLSDNEINTIRTKINELNKKIIDIEKKLHPDYRKQIEENLKLKQKELEEHTKIKPNEISDPSKDEKISEELKIKQQDLTSQNEALKELEEEIEKVQSKINDITFKVEELEKIHYEVKDFKTQIENYITIHKEKFIELDLEISEIIKLEINDNKIKEKIKEKENEINTLRNKLLSEEEINKKDLTDDEKNILLNNSLKIKDERIKEKIKEIKSQLSEPQIKYQQYLEELKEWNTKKGKIEGDENTLNTIKWYKKELKYIDNEIKNDLIKLRNERLELSSQIYRKKEDIISIYNSFKDAVDKQIKQFQNILGEYEINVHASLKIKSSFHDNFLGFINQNKKGSFYGNIDGKSMLEKLVKENYINDADGIRNLLSKIIEYLEKDKREGFNNENRNIKDQILSEEKWISFYDFVFSLDYLEPTYELKLGNKNLTQLSPGEKGALLIVFYLLLDKEDIPLIIDQPEENLDNESVYKILVNFISHAKKKRQVIIVTHNPNLAIVGDAEQIIFVKIDKKNNNIFSFESGAIENPKINKRASDILEGTLKAFDIRKLKYLRIKL